MLLVSEVRRHFGEHPECLAVEDSEDVMWVFANVQSSKVSGHLDCGLAR